VASSARYYEVIGEDEYEPGRWKVLRSDGLECGGRWVSQESAQKFCDQKNDQIDKALRERDN
jgi:hypothetical protein